MEQTEAAAAAAAAAWQEVRGASATGRRREEKRQKSRPKDGEVVFIYFLEAILRPALNI